MGLFKKSRYIDYIASACLISLIPAFYIWNNSLLVGVIYLVLGFVLSIDIIKHGHTTRRTVVAVLFFILYLVYIFMAGLTLAGAITLLVVVLFFLLRDSRMFQLYETFSNIFAILLAISFLVFVYVVYLGGFLPSLSIEPLNYSKTERYYLYPFLIVITEYGIVLPRFMGLFDEPGVVGTLCGIILIAEHFNLRKKRNWVFLLSGISSLSFFFFLMCLAYLVVYSKPKYIIYTGIVVISLAFVFKDNEVIQKRVWNRFVSEEGILVDNRTSSEFEKYYDSFRASPDYFWGLGKGVGHSHNEGGNSYKQFVVDYGIIFFFLYIACFFLIAIPELKISKNLLLFSISLLGTMYQRPFIEHHTYLFLFIASIVVLKCNSKKISSNISNCIIDGSLK